MLRHAFWGFFFGTVILYALVAFPPAWAFFELLSTFLALPGKLAAMVVAGPDVSDLGAMLQTFFNGVFYALVFMVLGSLFSRQRPA